MISFGVSIKVHAHYFLHRRPYVVTLVFLGGQRQIYNTSYWHKYKYPGKFPKSGR